MKKWVKTFWSKYRIIISSTVIVACLILTFLKNQQWVNTYTATFTIVLAVSTGFLAYFTWRSVRSVDERDKQNRKERLLNEIIEWAITINNKVEGDKLQPLVNITISESSILPVLHDIITQYITDISLSYTKIWYLTRLVTIFTPDLKNIVTNTTFILKKYRDYLVQWLSILDKERGVIMGAIDKEDQKNIYVISALRNDLVQVTYQVIEEAAKIKTENIK